MGYKHHPQLRRFQAHADPPAAIATYLQFVYQEALARGYNFSKAKIQGDGYAIRLLSTQGQLLYEWEHLKQKLKQRARLKYESVAAITRPEAHPMFDIIPGEIENWEAGGNRI